MPGGIVRAVITCRLMESDRGFVLINVVAFLLIFGALGVTGIYLLATMKEENQRIKDKKSEIEAEKEKIRILTLDEKINYNGLYPEPQGELLQTSLLDRLERELTNLQADPVNYNRDYTAGVIMICLAFVSYVVTFVVLRFYRRNVCRAINTITTRILDE